MCFSGTATIREVPEEEPMIGYRRFKVSDDGSGLESIYWGSPNWLGGSVKANFVPGVENPYGLHAYLTPDGARQLIRRDDAPVLAEVEAWGQVAVHDDGFRAEHMRIKRMTTTNYEPLTPERVAEKYGRDHLTACRDCRRGIRRDREIAAILARFPALEEPVTV